MSEKPKQLRFEDLQPHVDMLCDALENKGASSSGIPNLDVYPFAAKYRALLQQIRDKSISAEILASNLHGLRDQTLRAAKNNQYHRIDKIVYALDIFMVKEYNRVIGDKCDS